MLWKFWWWYLLKSWNVFFPQVPDIKKSKLSIKLGLFAGINVFWKVKMFIIDCFGYLLSKLISIIDSIILFFNKKTPLDEYIIFYDLETTGLNPYHSKIIEIAALLYSVEQKKVIDK